VATPSTKRGRVRGVPVSLESIQREAVSLFGEKSYPLTGMRDLSERVGILPGSLYAHISSKEELLLRIVESGIRNYTEAVAPFADAEGPADERLRGALRAHMRVLAATREQTLVTFQQWRYLGEDNRALVVQRRQEFEDLFTRILADGIASGVFRPVPHRRVAVLGIIGALNMATDWFSSTGSLSSDEIADALADNFLRGLVKEP
jgi:AcrR family transcriptional regulator